MDDTEDVVQQHRNKIIDIVKHLKGISILKYLFNI